MGEEIRLTASDGGSFSAYLALPARLPAPAVVVLPEIFNANPHIRSVADGWAVADITAGANEDNAVGDVMILQAEGQFWIPKDAKAVCGTNYATATTAPSDAQIPAALFTAGCLAG